MYRVNELKKTLEATKSFIKDRAPTRGNPLNPLGSLEPRKGQFTDCVYGRVISSIFCYSAERKAAFEQDSEIEEEEESILDEDEMDELNEADEVEVR